MANLLTQLSHVSYYKTEFSLFSVLEGHVETVALRPDFENLLHMFPLSQNRDWAPLACNLVLISSLPCVLTFAGSTATPLLV